MQFLEIVIQFLLLQLLPQTTKFHSFAREFSKHFYLFMLNCPHHEKRKQGCQMYNLKCTTL